MSTDVDPLWKRVWKTEGIRWLGPRGDGQADAMERFQHGFELGYAAAIDEENNVARKPYIIRIATCEESHKILMVLSAEELEVLESLERLNNELCENCCSPEISIRLAFEEEGRGCCELER